MKARYKLLIVILLLWLGMSYEGTRNVASPQTIGNSHNMTLEEQIRSYELGLIDQIIDNDGYVNSGDIKGIPEAAYQGNLVARAGRNIGNALQTLVRELLRGLVRFFDGVIS